MKSAFTVVGVVVTGALLGTFLGKLIRMAFPQGRIYNLFSTGIGPVGLHPTHMDLGIVDLTLGCLFRFDVTSILGIVLAAVIYKVVFR